jgi:hypothetical protein
MGNRGYPFENQDTLGTKVLVIDLKFDITQLSARIYDKPTE